MKTTHTISLLIAAGALLVSGTSAAQDGGAPAAPCDPTTLECSHGVAQVKAESMERLPGDVDTGWLPKCSSNGPHCDKKIQARAQIVFDPIKSGGPIYSVDMAKKKKTFVDARWPNKDKFLLSLPTGNKNDAKFTVAHTMTPEIGLYISVKNIYTGELKYDASALINLLPGAAFNYEAQNAGSFAPWGFEPVKINVKGDDLSNSQLFSVSFHDIGKMVGTNFDDYLTGKFGFNATSDTDFTYQTTQVLLETSGAKEVINYAGGTAELPNGGDFNELAVNATAKGIIRYEGTLHLKFVINITSVAGMSVNLNYPIDAYSMKYGNNNVPVNFPSTTVKIPLPNVWADTTSMDFGTVQTGQRSDAKTKSITNDGKLGAKLTFESSDSQFKLEESAATMDAESSYDLKIVFQPKKPGKQTATITIKSNDPDTPVQTFKVQGNGEGEALPDEPDAGSSDSGGAPAEQTGQEFNGSGNDGGCGCRAAGTGSTGSGAALFAMLGLAAAAIRRRRR